MFIIFHFVKITKKLKENYNFNIYKHLLKMINTTKIIKETFELN